MKPKMTLALCSACDLRLQSKTAHSKFACMRLLSSSPAYYRHQAADSGRCTVSLGLKEEVEAFSREACRDATVSTK